MTPAPESGSPLDISCPISVLNSSVLASWLSDETVLAELIKGRSRQFPARRKTPATVSTRQETARQPTIQPRDLAGFAVAAETTSSLRRGLRRAECSCRGVFARQSGSLRP